MAGEVGPRPDQRLHAGRTPERAEPLLQPDDVPLPLRRGSACGQHLRLYRGGRLRALQADARLRRLRADRVRRLRDPLRELRAQDGGAPHRADSRQRGQLPSPAAPDRGDVRLGPHGRHHRPRVLQVDAVALPAALQARSGRAEGGAGQLVPVVHDRAGERAGDRRGLRAVRHRGRAAVHPPMVLPDHRIRRQAARQPQAHRLVRHDPQGAAELDRALRGRRASFPDRGGERRGERGA